MLHRIGTTLPTLALLTLAAAAGAQDEERAAGLAFLAEGVGADDAPHGWLQWRGPDQTGASTETDLPDAIDAAAPLWRFDVAGRGTPVIDGERLYALCYDKPEGYLRERIVCLDARTGELIWEDRWPDFLSDSVYDRYALGSPSIHPVTGDVYVVTTGGLLRRYTRDGELLWEQSLAEEYGRLTYPNGRTGSVVFEGDLVISHFMYASWGPLAPARNRVLAFHAETGQHVWTATPGGPPKDASFCRPFLDTIGGRRVLYVGLAGGRMACVDARTGEELWFLQMSIGGVNSSPIAVSGRLYAIHGKENLDSSSIGRMIALDLDRVFEDTFAREAGAGMLQLDTSYELWRNDLEAFTSSPVLVGDRLYVTVASGELCAVNADTGEVLWHEKLAADQIHASPTWADGKLYVPMNDGSFHVIVPGDQGPNVLSTTQLDGNCLAAPAVGAGRVYVHTTAGLYCFGEAGEWGPAAHATRPASVTGPAARLQVIPGDVVIAPGEPVRFRVRALDANGNVVDEGPVDGEWTTPDFVASAGGDAGPAAFVCLTTGAGVVSFTDGESGLTGTARVRVAPVADHVIDFEDVELTPHPTDEGVLSGRVPPYFIGVGREFEVRELDGDQVLTKTIDNPLFQRANGFFGHPDQSGYTVQVDILAEGGRRTIASGGVFVQRYLVLLKGSHQELEVSSNEWQLKHAVPFRWKAKEWMTLKARVDVNDDGSGVVRAKAWRRDDPEPEAWTLELEVAEAHTHGAPGVFGLGPQSRYRVYLDNISVTSSDAGESVEDGND